MRCVLVSLGTLGDLHPFVAVALALKQHGHDPVLAAAEPCRPIAERYGITFQAVRPDGARVMTDTGLDEAASADAVAKDLGFVVDRVILPYADETLSDLMPLMAGVDCVICSSFSLLGRIAADAAGVPVVSILLQPMTLLSADNPSVLPNGSRALVFLRYLFGPPPVRWAIRVVSWIGRRRFGRLADLRKRIGAPPLEGDELIDGPLRSHHVIGLWSPAFSPAPRDAPANFSLAGFTFYDGGFTGAGLPKELDAFLREGSPPIVFTLGSFAVYADEGFYSASAEACRKIGRRAVLLVGEELLARHRDLAGPHIFVAGYVPHSKLFGRAAAVVHHGGMGTIAQAMRAGVPQLICPIFGDQFDNAARMERKGLGLKINRRSYTPDGAARSIQTLMTDDALAARARDCSVAVRIEDGAASVVAILATLCTGGDR